MRLKIHQIIVLFTLCDLVACGGYFTIVGSKLIRHGSKYHVSITSQGYDEPQTLELAIRSSKKSNEFELLQNVTLVNGKTQRIEFDLKGQPTGDYNLEAKSLSGDNFTKIVKLNMNTKKNSVFVQTDKSIYKPADKVQFRVLALNADMKPLQKVKAQVYITDGAQNRVKQFENVTMNKGVFLNELQLSDLPVMGHWKIHVEINNEKEVTKEFEVAEYTLPKFEVTIDANPDANYKEGKIRATVRAKYTFGKIAKGNATVTAEVVDSRREQRKMSKSVEVDGKKPIEFDIEKELGVKDQHRESTVKLFATFKEELTEREMNATASVIIHITPHKIEMKKSSEKFKPGLPFTVTAIVKYHDKGAPVNDNHSPLKFTIKYYYDVPRRCRQYRRRYYDDYDYSDEYSGRSYSHPTGFSLPQCRREKSYEEVKNVFVINGFADLNIEIPLNATKVDVEARYLETVSSVKGIKRSEAESNQFIQVKLETEKPTLSKTVKITVLATENLKQLTYQVLGKGDVIVSEVVDVANKKTAQIEFHPTLAMIPQASVVVYYITSDGEIISDSIKVKFGNELTNFVDIELSKNQAKPGEELEISISSKPNSFIGLLGVDQSVLLLKKGNDIEKSTVFDELGRYSEVNRHNNQWQRNEETKSYSDFKSSEAVVITNAKKEFERLPSPSYQSYRPRPYSFQSFSVAMPISKSSAVYRNRAQSHLLSGGMEYDTGFSDRSLFASAAPMSRGDSAPASAAPAPLAPAKKPRIIEIRKEFPETWLFDVFDFNSTTSNATFTKKVPDTITSWIISGFAVDPETGLGLSREPSRFNVFQPFFVSTNLPYSIKRGEVVSIPVLVFNYMDSDQEAEITLFNSEHEFEFAEINEDENQVRRRRRRSTDIQRKKKIIVKSQSGTSLSFMIRPLKIGHIKIKVVAESAIAGDGVERQLIVVPEGVTQFMNEAVFIDLKNNPEFKSNISIAIPPNAVPDSTRIEASAIGDILGPSIDNLDKLIKLPYGCGEQNMLNFVPNIVVMDYLTTVGKLTPEIKSTVIKYMESGYQRELTYKHDDGSYSIWGKSDSSGSTWLTAFVAKSFRQAAKYIMIDEKIIKQALRFLSNVQAADGSFPEVGRVFDQAMQGGASKGIGLTAYALISFLENQDSIKIYQDTIDKALSYIVSNLNSLDDNYSLAIATYALQLANHDSKDSLLAKLESKAENENGMKHWEKDVPKSDKNNPWSRRPNSVNVEMSAYALQALVAAGQEVDAIQVMKWLVTQRNENGGFQSTQDTVVGLQALAKLAAKIYVPNSKIDISVKQRDGSTTNLNINAENALMLQKHELPTYARDFEVTATGRGFSILQLSYRYNLNINGEWPRFILEPEVSSNSNKDFLHLSVCTNFVPDDSSEKSNMAVMEVSFPSGFTFDTDSLPELKSTENVKKIETKDSETVVIVYFDDLGAKKICPQFKAYRTHDVAKQKPAPIKIYDYYDNSRRASSFYNPPKISLCDICNGADECKEDCEQIEVNIS